MEMTIRMPDRYNVMSEEEMTYTNGGADLATLYLARDVVSWVVTGVMIINWADMLGGARKWYASNKTGNLATNIEKGVEAWTDYTTSSLWNGIRSIAATMTSLAGTIIVGGVGIPYGLIGTAAAFLTV